MEPTEPEKDRGNPLRTWLLQLAKTPLRVLVISIAAVFSSIGILALLRLYEVLVVKYLLDSWVK